ncbi:MAG: FAD-binding oxidoreductase [Cytophagales bacterium]|jgi:glycine/D-amino acid oxidase-like deaminating enzyme|nr:FAD-binding oxidoreductase [Cytophagales bacterium]
MQPHDFLIVGQGLAGSVLALQLLSHGRRVALFNDPATPAASAAAAGLFNPVTGRRMSKTWQADRLFPFLHEYYTQLERMLGERFFHPKTIVRPFVSVEEQNTWIAETARPDIARFATVNQNDIRLSEYVNTPFGSMLIRQSGYLDTAVFLAAARRHFLQLGILHETRFEHAQVQADANGVQYGEFAARRLVFCDGPHAVGNPFFDWLPFRPVKGEVLRLAIDDFPQDYIINQHLFVIPLTDGTFRAGATYDWRNLNWQASGAGQAELLEKATRLLRRPVRVLEHWAGIRPATADRRPLVGMHPAHPNIGFFGGMGSKGVSLVPYMAHHFTDFLLNGTEIMPETNINRYISLYKKAASGGW